MTNTERAYDLVVWGATGVAGSLVAEHLTERYDTGDLALALGGRDEDRLDALAADLAAQSDGWDAVPTIVGDATDRTSLDRIARQTRVVCTTVGPYTSLGTPLVEACLAAGTDYCDLTGEVNWVRETVDRFHDRATEAGVRVVHGCGFDSVPADLGTLLVQSLAAEQFGRPCDTVRVYVEDGEGGVSGGTLASFAETFAAASRDPIARQTLQNPYSLAPPGERDGVDRGAGRRPRNDRLYGEWTAPSPMAPVNERVVRRSNALLDYPWGREFRVSEVVPTGRGARGAVAAGAVAAGLSVFTAAMSVGPLRSGLRRFAFPAPGEGPSDEQVETGHFRVRVVGRGTAPDGPFAVESVIGADRDPGYGATARMVGEAATCLLRDETETPLEGGVLTPASGIGTPLADRLRDAGFTVTVGERAPDG